MDYRRRWAMRTRQPTTAPRLIDEEITPSSGWTQLPEFHCLLVDLPGFKKDDIKLNVEESGIIVVSGRRRIGEGKQVHFEKSFNVPEDGDVKSITTVFEEDALRISIPKVAREMKEEPKKTNGASSNDTKREDLEKPASSNETEEKDKEKKKADQSPASSSNHEEKKQEEHESPASSSNTEEEAKEEEKEETEGPAPISDIMEEKKEPVRSSEEEKTQHVDPAQGKQSSIPAEKSSHTSPVIVKIIENKGILIASILSFTLGVLLSQKFHPQPPN